MVDAVAQSIPGADVGFDPRWSKHRGRLYARFPWTAEPRTVAEAMNTLIGLTREELGRRLAQLGE